MSTPPTVESPVVVIGAGPAGLTAAYELSRRGRTVVVFEQDAQVGGLARTVQHNGFRFDIGGHRFFTRVRVVEQLWRAVLGPDFLTRPRLSRIYYRGRFFRYPLRPFDVAWKLGPWTSAAVLASYVAARLRPMPTEVSFADWVTNRFGRRLYQIFFKTYTEKVWGIPCENISADWAAQRIKGLSLRTAVTSMFRRPRRGKQAIKTLIEQFEYPRLGPGMMWERLAEIIARQGGRVELNTRVTGIVHEGDRITGVDVITAGSTRRVPASHVISTTTIPQLIAALDPKLPVVAEAAAARLKHRDFLTVALMLRQADVFPDNWIYIHDESVRVGRIQNYKNWSPDMVPDQTWTCLGLEYFCNADDTLWAKSDEALIALATRELAQVGIADPRQVESGVVVRVHDAYPVYDTGYRDSVETVKGYLARIQNLQLVGRNGMHKYNNQDHSMLTALLAVANLFGARHDLWSVNADDEYHEQGAHGDLDAAIEVVLDTQPLVPSELGTRPR